MRIDLSVISARVFTRLRLIVSQQRTKATANTVMMPAICGEYMLPGERTKP